jgi:hypothetical protein
MGLGGSKYLVCFLPIPAIEMTTTTAKTLFAAIAICALLGAIGRHIRNEPSVQRHLYQFQFLSTN